MGCKKKDYSHGPLSTERDFTFKSTHRIDDRFRRERKRETGWSARPFLLSPPSPLPLISMNESVAQEQRISLDNAVKLQRNMMRMVFGEVAYQRGLFPEDCFVLADVRALT